MYIWNIIFKIACVLAKIRKWRKYDKKSTSIYWVKINDQKNNSDERLNGQGVFKVNQCGWNWYGNDIDLESQNKKQRGF